jgi:transcriptional regulator with XRE-family HTH domain
MVAAACTERGENTSAQYIAQLRSGERTAPRLPLVEALADTFGVPVAYFCSDATGRLTADLLPLLVAMADPRIRSAVNSLDNIGTFLDALADPEIRAAVVQMSEERRIARK